jgi:luciferase family oxidoreductase group 1
MAPALSILDLCPIPSGSDASRAIANSLDLAVQAEALGYRRIWFAEHHNTAMLACSTPELLIARAAALTRTLRLGSGGVMLPNHSPLKVAETFRVLEAMAPGRIDLGLGRAPGTDGRTALALRRTLDADAEDFPRQLAELVGFLTDGLPEEHAFARVRAVPFDQPCPPIWILGSSLFGAQVAAHYGFGFAFAHHIQPEHAVEAMELYRHRFRASAFGAAPRAILAVSAICASTDAEAETLAGSADLAMLMFRQGRTDRKLPSAEEAAAHDWAPETLALRRTNRRRLQVGSPETVRRRIAALAAETGAEEVMVNSMIHDHAARRESYALLAEAFGLVRA